MSTFEEMTLDALGALRRAIGARLLAIDLDLARSKRDFICNGIERPFTERVTLDLERAELRVEKYRVDDRIAELKSVAQPRFGDTLAGLCRQAGRQDLVDQANQLATFGKVTAE
jgi:hypothetical protein